jgi:hypothetical protein
VSLELGRSKWSRVEVKHYVYMLIGGRAHPSDNPEMGYREHGRKKPRLWIPRAPRTAGNPDASASAAEPRNDEEWRKIRARVLHDRPWCEQPDCFLPATDIQPVSAMSNNVVSVCGSHYSVSPAQEHQEVATNGRVR